MYSRCKVQHGRGGTGEGSSIKDLRKEAWASSAKTNDISFSNHAAEAESLRIIDDMCPENYKLKSRTCTVIRCCPG